MVLSCCLLFTFTGCGGASVGTSDEVDYSQIPSQEYVHVLAASGSLDSLKTLLEQNPDMINARSVRNRNLLHTAALAGQDEVVKFLLEKGLSPKEPDDLGSYANELASNEGHPTTAKIIMDAMAN